MYKKITHTIVEEHFDHPVAGQIKKSMERSRIPTNEVFDEGTFISEADVLFTNYKDNLIKIADAVTGTEEELILALESILVDTDKITNLLKKFYATTQSEQIGIAMRLLPVLLVGAINQIKIGADPRYWTDRLTFQVANEIAAGLSTVNSSWNWQALNTIWSEITNNLVLKIKAIVKKDLTQDQQSTKIINSRLAEFQKSVTSGIVSQFPERFVGRVTLQYNHSDIM